MEAPPGEEREAWDLSSECREDGVFVRVAEELHRIDRRSGWARTREIGELVLEQLFGGSVECWRERGARRAHSLRRLAAQASCPLKKSALAEAVGVAVFVRENPQVLEWRHITPGHVGRVARVDRHEALALLRLA